MTSSRTNAGDHLFEESLEKFLVSTTIREKGTELGTNHNRVFMSGDLEG